MKKNIKLKIEIELSSEDEDKIESLLLQLISKTSSLVNKEVKKKNGGVFENSIKVECKYNNSIERN